MNAIRHQGSILAALEVHFDGALRRLEQLVHMEMAMSELDAAEILCRAKQVRAAGMLAGVALERHLTRVLSLHVAASDLPKKPTLGPMTNVLWANGLCDAATRTRLETYAVLRNHCAHAPGEDQSEPTVGEVRELIAGVREALQAIPPRA